MSDSAGGQVATSHPLGPGRALDPIETTCAPLPAASSQRPFAIRLSPVLEAILRAAGAGRCWLDSKRSKAIVSRHLERRPYQVSIP